MWSRSSRTLIFIILVLVLVLATLVASPRSYSQSSSLSHLCCPRLRLHPLRLRLLPTTSPRLPLPSLLPQSQHLSLAPSFPQLPVSSLVLTPPPLPCPFEHPLYHCTTDNPTHPLLLPLGANPYLPTGYVLNTWWVLKQNTQHGPIRSILITFVICPQFTHPNTHQVHVEYFQKVPTTEPVEGGLDLPTGSV